MDQKSPKRKRVQHSIEVTDLDKTISNSNNYKRKANMLNNTFEVSLDSPDFKRPAGKRLPTIKSSRTDTLQNILGDISQSTNDTATIANKFPNNRLLAINQHKVKNMQQKSSNH